MHRVLHDLHKKMTNKKVPLIRRVGAVAVVVLGVLVVAWLLGVMYRGTLETLQYSSVRDTAAGEGSAGFLAPQHGGVSEEAFDARSVADDADESLSMPPSPRPEPTPGDEAEEYEVTEYHATIETRHLTEVCDTIAALKPRTYVIFEEASRYEKGCSYRFKVQNARAAEVLAELEALEPDELSERTYTIQRQLEHYLDEAELLTKKLAALEETLAEAEAAYQELMQVAASAQNVESVAQVIDSRIQLIERLSERRQAIRAQLDRVNRQRAEAADRLHYTFFTVSVREDVFVDLDALGDSWKRGLKQFVTDVNSVVQGVTIKLIGYALILAQWLLYLALLLIVAKYGWRFGRELWTKR